MSHHSTKNSLALKPLIAPAFLVIGAIGIETALDAFGDASIANTDIARLLPNVATILLYLSLAFLLIRLIDVVIWNKLMRDHNYITPPLLRDIFAVLIWYLAGCAIFSLVLGQSLLHVMTASTVALGLIGFALQKPILDAFSGIVLALQQPFKVGDWLQADDQYGIGRTADDKSGIGRITEMNWRVVHLVTTDEITFVIPNSEFISKQTKVYSRPEKFFRDELRVTLPYSVTTYQGERILLGAVNQIEEIAAIPRKSIVSIADYTDRGVLWQLLYWCPDPGRIPAFRFRVHRNILRNLHYAGIEVPVPILDLRRVKPKANETEEMRGIDPLIQRASIFAALTADELRQLSSMSQNRLVTAGTPLLRQGDPGDSLYILRDGLLEVRISRGGRPETVVGCIHPGNFFGEMSLLLGEPRSASIVPVVDSMVSEISREAMTKLMHDRPELATYLGELLAEHQARDTKLTSQQHIAEQHQSILDQIVNRIRAFFAR